jgi:hypothetical protein
MCTQSSNSKSTVVDENSHYLEFVCIEIDNRFIGKSEIERRLF